MLIFHLRSAETSLENQSNFPISAEPIAQDPVSTLVQYGRRVEVGSRTAVLVIRVSQSAKTLLVYAL